MNLEDKIQKLTLQLSTHKDYESLSKMVQDQRILIKETLNDKKILVNKIEQQETNLRDVINELH